VSYNKCFPVRTCFVSRKCALWELLLHCINWYCSLYRATYMGL